MVGLRGTSSATAAPRHLVNDLALVDAGPGRGVTALGDHRAALRSVRVARELWWQPVMLRPSMKSFVPSGKVYSTA